MERRHSPPPPLGVLVARQEEECWANGIIGDYHKSPTPEGRMRAGVHWTCTTAIAPISLALGAGACPHLLLSSFFFLFLWFYWLMNSGMAWSFQGIYNFSFLTFSARHLVVSRGANHWHGVVFIGNRGTQCFVFALSIMFVYLSQFVYSIIVLLSTLPLVS